MPNRTWADYLVEQLETRDEERRCDLIHDFVQQGRAEDVYLDFIVKSDASKASLDNDDRRNLAKAISGFAHSDGGILVWGVDARRKDHGDSESPDVAQGLQPIANLSAFQSNLNQYLRDATTPPVDGVRNLSVREKHDGDKGYVVTYVPVGLTPPYRATICNNNFYKRSGSTFYRMEPYDIRDVVFRFSYPKVKLKFAREDLQKDSAIHVYSLAITVRNEGPQALEKWKLVVEVPQVLWEAVPADLRRDLRGFSRGPYGIGEKRLVRHELVSHYVVRTNVGADLITVFPEDEVQVAGRDVGRLVLYAVTHEIHRISLPQIIHWRFYADPAPKQQGEISVKSVYEEGEPPFCII